MLRGFFQRTEIAGPAELPNSETVTPKTTFMNAPKMVPLRNARVRLLVRHSESQTFVRNTILNRGLRDAILQAHAATLDGSHAAFIAVNEVIVGLYLRGTRQRYAYVDERGRKHRCEAVPLPAALRTGTMTWAGARTALLPGLERQEERRMA